jgi:hypothetical protein
LMRLRLSRMPVPGESSGGIAFGGSGPDQSGLSVQLVLLPDGTSGLVIADDAGVGPGRSASVRWQANRWYWLRVRHAPNAISGYPDLLARLWPADGETVEPEAWTVYWDYHPRYGIRAGSVGIRAPREEAETGLECDYILVKADGLDPITVRLPALKPDRPELRGAAASSSTGFNFDLWGRPHGVYVVESSLDLVSWSSAVVAVTDQVGRWRFDHQEAGDDGAAFFRARISE